MINLTTLSNKELQELSQTITIEQLSRMDKYPIIFDTLRHLSKLKFSSEQISGFLDWDALPLKKQELFKAAWNTAIKFLVAIGFPNNEKTEQLLINMVLHSPNLIRLRFEIIIAILKDIAGLINHHFPYYPAEAFRFIGERLKD